MCKPVAGLLPETDTTNYDVLEVDCTGALSPFKRRVEIIVIIEFMFMFTEKNISFLSSRDGFSFKPMYMYFEAVISGTGFTTRENPLISLHGSARCHVELTRSENWVLDFERGCV